jgi:hypothetical protein
MTMARIASAVMTTADSRIQTDLARVINSTRGGGSQSPPRFCFA